MIDARWRSAVDRSARRVFHRLPSFVRRPVHRMRARLLPVGRRRHRTVALPGRGPVVLVDARGCDWDRVAARVSMIEQRPERLVVVTDRPEMHVARELPVVVEFVTADDPLHEVAERRLREIRRVYAVDVVERLDGGAFGTVSAC